MLSTPPAFILSQDQTLMLKVLIQPEYLAFLNQKQVPTGILIQVLLFLRFALLKAVRSSFDDLNYYSRTKSFCNPEEIFDFFWQALLVCGLIRFRIFQGYSLFSYQCSLLFLATLIYYHNHLCLSTTFLFYFASLWSGLLSLTCDSLLIITNHNSFVNIFFDKKLHFFFVCFSDWKIRSYLL